MFSNKINSKSFNLHRDESGQTALETAIILIAFVVVASVFAFTILSAGQASTDKGEKAIYAGLAGVESSMAVKGAVLAEAATSGATAITDVVFTVALASGGDPVDLTVPGTTNLNKVTIGYRDATQTVANTSWTVKWIATNDGAGVGSGAATNELLEANELAEITVPMTGITAPGPNTQFTLEVKPPTGSVLNITRTLPAALALVMELR